MRVGQVEEVAGTEAGVGAGAGTVAGAGAPAQVAQLSSWLTEIH